MSHHILWLGWYWKTYELHRKIIRYLIQFLENESLLIDLQFSTHSLCFTSNNRYIHSQWNFIDRQRILLCMSRSMSCLFLYVLPRSIFRQCVTAVNHGFQPPGNLLWLIKSDWEIIELKILLPQTLLPQSACKRK